jgi:DNA-binding NarL/FixJ family response regulator
MRPLRASPGLKLIALMPRTASLESKNHEVSSFPENLLSSLHARSAGDHSAKLSSHTGEPLTTRECEVLAMISQGLSNKRIARTLEISPETVKSHVKHIFLKLNVSTRTEAVFRAISLELL